MPWIPETACMYTESCRSGWKVLDFSPCTYLYHPGARPPQDTCSACVHRLRPQEMHSRIHTVPRNTARLSHPFIRTAGMNPENLYTTADAALVVMICEMRLRLENMALRSTRRHRWRRCARLIPLLRSRKRTIGPRYGVPPLRVLVTCHLDADQYCQGADAPAVS